MVNPIAAARVAAAIDSTGPGPATGNSGGMMITAEIAASAIHRTGYQPSARRCPRRTRHAPPGRCRATTVTAYSFVLNRRNSPFYCRRHDLAGKLLGSGDAPHGKIRK